MEKLSFSGRERDGTEVVDCVRGGKMDRKANEVLLIMTRKWLRRQVRCSR